jgi:uroporphyrin-III C-methyltransferase
MNIHPKLTLVGAGPGDPELITIKAVRALESADVVLYDALVDLELLQYAKNAIHIPVGKRAGKSSVSQDTINSLIVESAHRHGHVVRLKGGDPFVFGRGFEEKEFAEAHGIETAVVLGISSIMLPGLFGIPLTCRGVNQSFTVVTATTKEGVLSKEVLIAAKVSPTPLYFMGLGKIDLIVAEYIKNKRSDLPVAIVSKGSHADGCVIKGNVGSIINLVEKKQPEAPALLIFGEGARFATDYLAKDIWWEENRVVA